LRIGPKGKIHYNTRYIISTRIDQGPVPRKLDNFILGINISHIL